MTSTAVIGVGTDVVAVRRIRSLVGRRGEVFARKWFTRDEIEYCLAMPDPPRHLAGRLAAKEAVYKALRLPVQSTMVPWRDVEVIREECGAPSVRLRGDLARAADLISAGPILISISHNADHATATALAFRSTPIQSD